MNTEWLFPEFEKTEEKKEEEENPSTESEQIIDGQLQLPFESQSS